MGLVRIVANWGTCSRIWKGPERLHHTEPGAYTAPRPWGTAVSEQNHGKCDIMEGLGLSLWPSYCLAHNIQQVLATKIFTTDGL